MTTRPEKFALIGAGPMGLAMARNLRRFGLSFDAFEIHDEIGGLWNIENPHSTMYESAHLISSKRMTEFSEFPMRDEAADYPSHAEILRYFLDYADEFDLRQEYRFGVRVVGTERMGGSAEGHWRVSWQDASDSEAPIESGEYRGVLIATGIFSKPNLPEFSGRDAFHGEILHSSSYRSPAIFEGKRVLVVGAGNSGCDIAVDAVHRARSVDMSLRRGYHFVPKYVFGRPADTAGGWFKLPRALKQRIDRLILGLFTGNPRNFGFPAPDHKLYESHPIVNSLVLHYAGHGDLGVQGDIERLSGQTVYFKDGTSKDYDLVLLATGYKLHYPFLDSAELNWTGPIPRLYLNCFHPERDDVFLLGMVEATGLGWQGRFEQAELVARYLAGLDAGSTRAEAFRELKSEPFPDMRGGWNYLPLDRMAFYVHKDTYRNTLRRHIRELGG